MQTFLVSACLIVCGISFLQLRSLWSHKLGMTFIWLASGYAVYGISGSYWAGLVCLLSWIFVPLWEVFFVLRHLRVPRERELADARAPQEEFEELSELTGDLMDLDFKQVDECRQNPAPYPHYYRLFVHENGNTHATIGYISQGNVGFHFIAFSSESKDGRRWVTWDYPLTYGLVMPPEISVFRLLQLETVEDLYLAHLDFLEINELSPDDLVVTEITREAVRERLAGTLARQVEYNVDHGFLAPDASEEGSGNLRYSWRGTWFVAPTSDSGPLSFLAGWCILFFQKIYRSVLAGDSSNKG